MNDFTVHIEGLSPTVEHQISFENKLTRVVDEAPSNSVVSVRVGRNGSVLRGQIRVNSYAGSFFAMASSDNLDSLADQLIYRIRIRLNRWKAKRFKENSYEAAV